MAPSSEGEADLGPALEYALATFGYADVHAFSAWLEDLGVLYTNPGPNVVHANDFTAFPLDGFGIDGNGGIELTFLQPTYAVGSHGPGFWTFKAYLGDVLVYSSPAHLPAPGGFAGFVSTSPFDRGQLLGLQNGGSIDDVYIDNTYFGTVPTPPAVAMMLLGLAMGRRRRR